MAIVSGSFALSGGSFYLKPVSDFVPTAVTSFPVILNPCEMLDVGGYPELYGYDINGRVYKRDISRPYPRTITLDYDLTAIDVVMLQKLQTWMSGMTLLWAIDGIGIKNSTGGYFRYYYDDTHKDSTGDMFNLMSSGTKSYYTEMPYIAAWQGYISELSGDFWSSRKMSGGGSVTLSVTGVYYNVLYSYSSGELSWGTGNKGSYSPL